ncbi:MAG: hypothetical protein DRQ49_09810 [Gammaproteobacteria bacterium]|nr:MAG: hypothetical protein DRQ49_09810 [Gammaproteobacteria bacterium]RKZ42328.1 MAG: hypothetical protein DRQ41_07120 [Gammaproteobacteria bacterium]RKZ73363.1 MAG: hypothetical protein DRQ57_14650 [Gammaproteobacteria bacterium]
MATPFSHTTRSLQNNNDFLSQAGLLVAILFAIMWGYWFLTAKITSYEVSQELYVTDKEKFFRQFSQGEGAKRVQTIRNRLIIAQFPQTALDNIQIGQDALIRLDGDDKLTIPATVINVRQTAGKAIVELRAEIDATLPNPFEEGKGGKVRIEVEYVTPAILVLRASGMFTKTPSLSASPQRRD